MGHRHDLQALNKRNEKIVDEYIDGKTIKSLARLYNLTEEHVTKIIRERKIFERWQK